MKILIFDLDGTLLDTLEDIGSAFNMVLAAHGFKQHPMEAYRRMVGNGFQTLARRAIPPEAPHDEEFMAQIIEEARQTYFANMMDHTKPYPGLTEALAKLEDAGVSLAVLSNKPDPMTQELIRHYYPDIHFTHVQGALPDIPLKPDPQGVLAMLRKLCVPKSECAYVGDSNVDVITARNAHVKSVGVAWGFRGSEELAKSKVSVIITEPGELLSLTDMA